MERLRDPFFWTTALQIPKTALAAALAWVLAHTLFDVAQPFLAPRDPPQMAGSVASTLEREREVGHTKVA